MLIKNEESAWQRASASLDATAKIYGYRVDSVHTETFKFLGGLNRNKKELNLKEDNEEEVQEEIIEDNTKKKEKVRRGVNTLETNNKKLNLSKYDIDCDVDPLFSVMTSKFNESTAKGLLLNTIPLDENINYILESKNDDDKPSSKSKSKHRSSEEKNDKKKDDNKSSNNDTESEKDDTSEDVSDTRKIKEALNLANNLQKKDEDKDLIKNAQISCANDFENVKESIKKVLKSFIKDNSIDDFVHLQICPELSVFRESRKLNTEETNVSFINTFKEEINQADKKLAHGDYDENASIIDEEEQDNLAEAEEGMAEIQDENSNAENAPNPEQEEGVNDPGNFNNANFNPKAENNFTVFKYEDLIERAGHFGTGNTQNLPQFMNFAKNFGKLEKNSFFNKGSMLGLKKEGGIKKKKEEKNFVFDESNEVNINDLFTEMRSKIPLNKANDYSNDYEKRRKVKCFFNFDKLSQFKLFAITGKTITSKDIDNDLDINQQEKNLEDNNNKGSGDGEAEGDEKENQNDIIGFEKNNEGDSFYQNEKKAEKNFGRLYRKFDIRSLKKKIWTSYEDIKNEHIDFKNVVTNMSKTMTEDEIFSISTPTCFVCMLHLCNEKNLFIEQKDMNTFYIERDPDGAKSARASGKKVMRDDDSSSDSD